MVKAVQVYENYARGPLAARIPLFGLACEVAQGAQNIHDIYETVMMRRRVKEQPTPFSAY